MKFKVGDIVRRKRDGFRDEVVGVPGTPRYDRMLYVDAERGMRTKRDGWSYQDDWELALANPAAKAVVQAPTVFVVTYDEDGEDPAKHFTSQAELMKWLKEAREDEDIVWSSIRVFEVKAEYRPETSVRLKLLPKVGLKKFRSVKRRTKRGRPRKAA